MSGIKYRDYSIDYNPKPIPTTSHDWDFVHSDYNGPGDSRCGTAAGVADAKHEIDELILDEEEDV